MVFTRYTSAEELSAATLEVLMEHEVQNNLQIGLLGRRQSGTENWFMATVSDGGGVVLTALQTGEPFKVLLYETRNKPNAAAV
ncbi:MAG: hypothetical protein LBN30_08015 [Oscillospiraceae bacterium]|jgi:hypothetical protein|nr:hypothetical protein [Oscillospiraceae bacterium]